MLTIKSSVLAALIVVAPLSFAELFIYEAANGNRIVSDKPLRQVKLPMLSFGEPGDALYQEQSATLNTQYDALIKQASMLYGVDFALIKAVIRAESAFDPLAVSNKGAQGLMQLMPLTSERYAVNDPFNAKDNIDAGTRHLRYLLNVFNQNTAWALAAYNAGEGAVREYAGIPPYTETEFYVQKVLGWYGDYQ